MAPGRIPAVADEHKEARRVLLATSPSLLCGMSHERLLTLPNVVSMSRLVLAAGFVGTREPSLRLALIAVASGTDFLDGWLARRHAAVSRWGALIDPIADRLFVLCALFTFLYEQSLTTGAFLVLISRDIATAIGFIVARSVPWLRDVVFRARLLGKIVTVLQLVTLVAIIVGPSLVPGLVLAVGVASAASIADYTLTLWRERAT
jgi:CDP-diacylglycerol--glycerol-3-phosphate 3-phosphatidyltransferase/cardiolipin synthase